MFFFRKFNLFEVKHKFKILFHRHISVKRWNFGEVTDFCLCLFRIFKYFLSVNSYCARCGRNIPCDYIHSGRFSGTVRAKKSEDFALANSKADIIDSFDVAVIFCEFFNLNHVTCSLLNNSKHIKTLCTPQSHIATAYIILYKNSFVYIFYEKS